jgi:hypothetical protein
LHAVVKALRDQSVILKGPEALLSMNQPEGFDCPKKESKLTEGTEENEY